MRKLIKGFSLVEMAIIIVIASLFTGLILMTAPVSTQTSQIEANNKKFDEIEKALNQFVRVNRRLPCSADITIDPNSGSFGFEQTNCSTTIPGDFELTPAVRVRNGMVPVRTLGLPDDYAFDTWGNRIRYIVLSPLAATAPFPVPNFITFLNFFTVFDPNTRPIQILNASGNAINKANIYTAPTENNTVAYVLLSHGENGNGAVPYAGGAVPACPASGLLDQENCNGDANFRDASLSFSGSNYFDDIIRWKTFNQLRIDSGVQHMDSSGSNVGYGFHVDTAAIIPNNADTARLTRQYNAEFTNNTLGISSISGFAANTWMARGYNTLEKNFRIMPLIQTNPAAGQFTLQPGKYRISAQGYLFTTANTNIAYRIVNVTSGETRTGTIMTINANTHDNHGVQGVFDVTVNSVFRVEVMVSLYNGSTRFVNNINLASSTAWNYFEIEITRIS